MATSSTVNKPLHVGLFLATCGSTFLACYAFMGGGLLGSALFSLALMSILLSHEMGHYVMARRHGVDASWPYFIPVPLGFGTLGAVIRLKAKIPTRNALVDIGAAGPLAGLVVCIPLLALGVKLSTVTPMPDDFVAPLPPVYSLAHLAAIFGQELSALFRGTPEPLLPVNEVFGDSVLSWLLVRLIHGELPAGTDLLAHPLFLAAWFGQLMTMLNLLPVGQLDGGHLTFAWYGAEKAEALGVRVAKLALLLALCFSVSWLVWFFLVTRLIGPGHPPVERPDEPLSFSRKVVVVIAWVMTGLTFMPMPVSLG